MSTGVITLSRQAGLLGEMQSIANNIANLSTAGFRREGVVFSEYVKATEGAGGSISMAAARGRHVDMSQGSLEPTGGMLDVAIEGDGFFLIETPLGERLTRAGHFSTDGEGLLSTADGNRVLDEGGAPIFIPTDARNVAIASDGTISIEGRPQSRLGVVHPVEGAALSRESGTMFAASGGFEPLDEVNLVQGFVEQSNVNPILEITRMIEVQRAYELGQTFTDKESERVSAVIRTVTE
jgi:flagellar basal-body rod protein FlgF